MRWWLVAAGLLAALACELVVLVDAFFVIRYEASHIGAWRESILGCFTLTTEMNMPEIRVPEPYLQFGPSQAYVRLSRAGAALFGVACAAPFIALLALVWRASSSGFRHLLLLFAAVAPLVALELFGVEARALHAEDTSFHADMLVTFRTSSLTWAARGIWGTFAVVVAASWWLAVRNRDPRRIDPATFD